MNCCPKYESGEAYAFAIITVWIELGCGVVAATWPAFFHNKSGDTWAYLIFGLYTTFALFTFLYSGWTLCSRARKTRQNCLVMNWFCVITTFATLGIFYHYMGHPETPLSDTVVNLFGLFVVTVAILSIGYVCSVNFLPNWTDPCPLVVMTILVEMGTGLLGTTKAVFFNDKVNVWAYSVFGIYATFSAVLLWYIGRELLAFVKGNRSKMVYGLLDVCTLVTGGCFCVLFFTQFTLPSGRLSTLEKEIFWSFIIYIFAVDALLLLLFRWTFSIPGCECGSREDSDWHEHDDERSESGVKESDEKDVEKGKDSQVKMITNHMENNPGQELSGSASTIGPDSAFEVRVI